MPQRQADVLGVLIVDGEQDGPTLGARLGLSSGKIAEALAALDAAGVIDRETRPPDGPGRPAHVVRISQNGRQTVEGLLSARGDALLRIRIALARQAVSRPSGEETPGADR